MLSRPLPLILSWTLLLTGAAAALALVPGVPGASGGSSDRQPTEYETKAAILFKLANHTTWPAEVFADESAPFVIGVLGADPFGATLDATVKDKKIGKHPVRVERYAVPDHVGAPHLLFVAGGDPAKAIAAAKTFRTRPMLLVGDCAGFAERGATAGLYLEKGHVRFELNPAALKRARLLVEAGVLKLARIVEEPR